MAEQEVAEQEVAMAEQEEAVGVDKKNNYNH